MTTETTRNLSREVAEALVNSGKFSQEDMVWKGQPNYPNDLNACARDLTREGYRVGLHQTGDMWEVSYYPDDNFFSAQPSVKPVIWSQKSSNPAVAWCESFLALCKHVDGQGGEGR